MRVLIAHNCYQQEGGEDGVVANEQSLLTRYGTEVILYSVSNDEITSWQSKLKTLASVAYSHSALKAFSACVARVKPDIVHVHNFFPLLTPSIYDACATAGVSVVQTLHNYRTICVGALLLRDGKICQTCVGASPYWGTLHACYRDSRLASAGVAHMISHHRRRGTWKSKVDRFIALTNFARERFIAGGLPADRIVTKPNVVLRSNALQTQGRHGALYVGRLSEEKGIRSLVRAWSDLDYPLTVVGDGPLAETLRAAAGPNVAFLGKVSQARVSEEMVKAAFLVVPSICFENYPLAIAEAYACGLPTIVSRLGAMAEIVSDGVTGLHVEPTQHKDLAAKVLWAANHPSEMQIMGRNAYSVYQQQLAPEANYRTLIDIYTSAIEARAARRYAGADFDMASSHQEQLT